MNKKLTRLKFICFALAITWVICIPNFINMMGGGLMNAPPLLLGIFLSISILNFIFVKKTEWILRFLHMEQHATQDSSRLHISAYISLFTALFFYFLWIFGFF